MSAPPELPPIPNQMILASAGSGKTYTLTSRFVQLLARGVSPHRILALTFTRKAAGEFLDEILKKLSAAASDPTQAATLAKDLQLPHLDSEEATRLLRFMVRDLHRLTLSTLDSFFHRILNAFPSEFGLASGFKILDEHETELVRNQVFASLFEERTLHRSFVTAFREATFGHEEKALRPLLHKFVTDHHRLLMQAPQAKQWGEEHHIWGAQGSRWLRGLPDIKAEVQTVRRLLEDLDLNKTATGMWDGFLDAAAAMTPGAKRGKISQTLLKRLYEQEEEISRGGPVSIKLSRNEYELSFEFCTHLSRVLNYLFACELIPHLRRTKGIFQLLQAYEQRYHAQVRRAGKLGFDDVQLLLSGQINDGTARTPLGLDGSFGRLNIDYRLDGQFDHWLMDEFQDTSLPQWRVIENLVDEVLQDLSGERSFFYVGDVKQAIFGWRGGDAHLFQDIFDHYQHPDSPRLEKETMELSWRAGPHLLQAVNRIFGQPELLGALFPEHPSTVQRWNETWRNHESVHQNRADYTELLTFPKDPPGDDRIPWERRMEAVAHLLNDLSPTARGISVAVLVRTNHAALELADFLRATTNLEVVVDGDTRT
ncbi:MAG: UvrD-helicase domain-containing protein [Verrucomicrobiota bacterium]